jgi:hypothetical protein
MTKASKAKGRTLAEFEKDLSPAEKKVLAAARDGEFAVLGDARPEGVLIVHRQSPGAPPPQEHFAKAPILADATWRRALGPAKDGAHLWAARFEGHDLLALAKDARAPTQAFRLVAARNRRGWTIPRRAERRVAPLAEAVADLEARRLRPGFVRFLALGGDEAAPVHEKGVQIAGGWIDGEMDCEGAVLPHDLILWDCRLDGDLILRSATTRSLCLDGTRLKVILGDQLATAGGVFLREGFHATGEVRLLGARIGGGLGCNAGRFENPGGDALSCDGAEITGDVFLHNGFHASGAVRLLGARIGGDLACDGGRFDNPKGVALHCDRVETKGGVFLHNGFHASGEVRLLGARIGGDLDCNGGRFEKPKGVALQCDGAIITGAFFLGGGAHFDGISLGPAKIGSLVDDEACWPKPIVLDGFRYDRLAGDAPVDAAARLRWLDLQRRSHLNQDFKPQPWEQLIKVLREMGHHHAARDIAIEKQNRLRRLGKIRTPLRIPTKSARYSNSKPATYSDLKPAGVPTRSRPPGNALKVVG